MESLVKAIEQFICELNTRIAELKSEIATLQAENAELDDTLTSLTREEREFDKTARTLQERLWKSQEQVSQLTTEQLTRYSQIWKQRLYLKGSSVKFRTILQLICLKSLRDREDAWLTTEACTQTKFL